MALALGALLLAAAPACAEGLLRIKDCRIVDDQGPVKAMGVNYVDGFWKFAKDGKREDYLPYLDALAEAKIPFIRMSFGPWAAYKPDEPPARQIVDFVENRERYFERFDVFLADLKTRRIGVVLDVFWNIDPYTVYFNESPSAATSPESRTFAFLKRTVEEFGRRFRADDSIWMWEFINEGNMFIDFSKAPHSRRDLVAQTRELAAALRSVGDRHLVGTGNSMPRPAAEHLNAEANWKPDSLEEFFTALDAETAANAQVASVHIYTEAPNLRPWSGGNILEALQKAVAHANKECKGVFVGEFGNRDPTATQEMISSISQSGVPLAALWGFGRIPPDRFKFGLDERGKALLHALAQQSER